MAVETGIRVKIDASQATQGARQFGRAMSSMEKSATGSTQAIGGSFEDFGRTLKRAAAGAALAGGAIASGASFASFQAGLIDVARTTDLADDKLAELGDNLESLSIRTGVGTAKLLELTKVSGQLGVRGVGGLTAFATAVAELDVATSGLLAGEEAAFALSRIMKLTGEGPAQVNALANVIARLGDEVEATEPEIAALATRVAQGLSIFNASSTEVASLSAAMAAAGIEAERGGSAIGRVLRNMATELAKNSEEGQAFARILGTTRGELRGLIVDDPTEVVTMLAGALKTAADEGRDITAVFESIGIKGDRDIQVLGTLANQYDELVRVQELARKESTEQTKLDAELARNLEKLQVQQDRFGNAIGSVARDIGALFVPALSKLLESGTTFFTLVGRLTDRFVTWGQRIGEVVGGLTFLFDVITNGLAAIWGIDISLDEADEAAQNFAKSLDDAGDATTDFGDDSDETAEKLKDLIEQIEDLNREAADALAPEFAAELGNIRDRGHEIEEAFRDAGLELSNYPELLNQVRAAIEDLEFAATRDAVDSLTESVLDNRDAFEQQIDELEALREQIDPTISGYDGFIETIDLAIAKLQEQKATHDFLASSLGQLTTDIAEFAEDGIGQLSDEIATLATTGKANFAALAQSMVQSLIKIMIQALLTRAALAALNAAGGGGATTISGALLNILGPSQSADTGPSSGSSIAQVQSAVGGGGGQSAFVATAGGASAGAGVNVVVNNNGQPAEATATTQKRETNNGFELDVIVDMTESRIAERLQNGGGTLAPTLRQINRSRGTEAR